MIPGDGKRWGIQPPLQEGVWKARGMPNRPKAEQKKKVPISSSTFLVWELSHIPLDFLYQYICLKLFMVLVLSHMIQY